MSEFSLIESLNDEQIFINSVEFGADAIIITFQERRNVTESVAMLNSMTLAMDSDERIALYENLQSALSREVDEGYVFLRNPEESF